MKKVKSFIYMLNSRGPRTDPCGTPHVTSSQELYVEFILTCCFQDVRYSKISLRLSFPKSYASSFASRSSCDVQSKALERSMRTIPTIPLLSRLFQHCSTSLIRACCGLWCSRNAQSKLENLEIIKGKICCDSTLS